MLVSPKWGARPKFRSTTCVSQCYIGRRYTNALYATKTRASASTHDGASNDESILSQEEVGVHPIVEAAVDNTSNHAPEVHVAEAEPLALEPSPSLVPTLLDPNGWILAFSILAASRLGRASAQEARLDVRLVLQERQRNRAFGSELRRKREIWLQQEAERKLGEDAKRVEEATERARETARLEKERQLKYQQEAAAEAERVRQQVQSQKKQYEAEQSRLDAEYKARLEQEMKVIEEQREKARQEEERRRKAEEERQRQLEEERRQREEEERKAREEAIRQRIEERKRLEKEKKQFAVRVEGQIIAEKPTSGTLVPGPLEKEAKVQLSVSASTLLGGATQPTIALYPNTADASEQLVSVVGQQAQTALVACASAMRLQGMTGSGPLQFLGEVELQHWLALASMRTAIQGIAAGQTAITKLGKSAKAEEKFEARTEYGVLPQDHAKRTDAILQRVIGRIEAGCGQSEVHSALEDLMETDNAILYSDIKVLPECLIKTPKFLGAALTLAHLLNVMLHDRPAKVSDAPAWFESAAEIVRQELRELVVGAPQDSLQVPATLLSLVLGPDHPLAREMASIAEANQSPITRQLAQEKQRIYQTELAEKLLEEEWPDETEMRAARMADKEAKTPIPERVWALRNVAGTLAMGGPGERAKARKFLEQAVKLKQKFAGAPDHPAVLPELIPLSSLLSSVPDWAQDASGVASLILRVLGNIAAAYEANNDAISAAILLEAGIRKFEEEAGVKSAAVRAATKQADKLLDSMPADDRTTVASNRSKYEEVINHVSNSLTEELGAYKQSSERSKVDEWNARGAAMIGTLRFA